MVNFIKDLKDYLKARLSEKGFDMQVRDSVPDGQPIDDSISMSAVSLKTEKIYESFDGGTADVTEVEFRTVTVAKDGEKTAEERNAEIVGAIRALFDFTAAADWNASVVRTDMTDFESPHPISDSDERYESMLKVQFTVLMPYAALK